MKIHDALNGVSRLFLDTAPVIYFVEQNPQFVDLVEPIDQRDYDSNNICASNPQTSPIAPIKSCQSPKIYNQ